MCHTFADKARLTQNKCRVNLFFFLFLEPVHGACQQQTRHKPGCMFDTMGLQVRAAQDATVQRNTNDICCTWKRGIILPLGIPRRDPRRHCFSSSRDTKRTAMPRQRGSGVFRPWTPSASKKTPCLCFLQRRRRRLSWESLTDSSLYASLLCDSYHTTESSALASSSPFLFRGMKIHIPPLHTDTSLSLPARLEEK